MSTHPDFGDDDLAWYQATCPACGLDWWHAVEAGEGMTADDVHVLIALLGVCADCRKPPRRNHTPRPRPRRRRDRR